MFLGNGETLVPPPARRGSSRPGDLQGDYISLQFSTANGSVPNKSNPGLEIKQKQSKMEVFNFFFHLWTGTCCRGPSYWAKTEVGFRGVATSMHVTCARCPFLCRNMSWNVWYVIAKSVFPRQYFISHLSDQHNEHFCSCINSTWKKPHLVENYQIEGKCLILRIPLGLSLRMGIGQHSWKDRLSSSCRSNKVIGEWVRNGCISSLGELWIA